MQQSQAGVVRNRLHGWQGKMRTSKGIQVSHTQKAQQPEQAARAVTSQALAHLTWTQQQALAAYHHAWGACRRPPTQPCPQPQAGQPPWPACHCRAGWSGCQAPPPAALRLHTQYQVSDTPSGHLQLLLWLPCVLEWAPLHTQGLQKVNAVVLLDDSNQAAHLLQLLLLAQPTPALTWTGAGGQL